MFYATFLALSKTEERKLAKKTTTEHKPVLKCSIKEYWRSKKSISGPLSKTQMLYAVRPYKSDS